MCQSQHTAPLCERKLHLSDAAHTCVPNAESLKCKCSAAQGVSRPAGEADAATIPGDDSHRDSCDSLAALLPSFAHRRDVQTIARAYKVKCEAQYASA
eukprot:19223-Heterococcus_DN1.PRE.3